MPIARLPAYAQIAADLRRAVVAGEYEPVPEELRSADLPSAAELGARYGVSQKTAARAIQQLVTEGLADARSGMRATAIPRAHRTVRWPMAGRYARAREAGGLVFETDMQGRDVRKRVTSTGWVEVPASLAAALAVEPGAQVWSRARQTLVDDAPAELSVSYFPAPVTERAPDLTTTGDFPNGGVVGVLERAGHSIARTVNEVRARLATADEVDAFTPDGSLQPLVGRVVLEVSHITYGADDQPLEAVVSVRPSADSAVMFETDETSGARRTDEASTQ
ncbi:MAG: GntR family transcriptional regulator [Solirubrobacteraceae bacterium]|jgi:GntR family transcriptional regulator|nr:GntR family transcriptional regulator [Solirubrobacteraceae bacterium]